MKYLFLLTLGLTLSCSQLFAQGKAKIIIKKNIDGEETVIEKEYDLSEGQDLSELLEGEDIEIDFHFEDNPMSSFFRFDDDFSGFFGNEPLHDDGPILGITEEQGKDGAGVHVAQVIAGSTAEAMGILPEDVITRFNGSDVYDMADLKRLIQDSSVGEEVKIELERGGKRKKFKGELLTSPHSNQANNWFQMTPDADIQFDFDGAMDMRQLEDMMRMMEEQMKAMNPNFQMPRSGEQNIEDDFELFYDVPGRYPEMEGSGLRFDHISPADIAAMPSNTELSITDDLQLQGLRFLPLGSSSSFELHFLVSATEDLSITIYDAEGKMVYYEMLGDFSGDYDNVIDLNDRPEGDYFLELEQGGKHFSRKVIKG